MSNRVCDILGIEYPVIQGAMAWTSLSPLVAAVSEAGGLGVLGSGFMPAHIIAAQVEEVRKTTDKPFAANLFLDPGPQLDIGCQAIIDNKVPIAYVDTLNLLEYDMAKKYYDRLHAAGCKVVAKINCLSDALVAEKAGADVIITKGVEGGGHCAKISGSVLLAEVTQNISSVPIVASGGIAIPIQAAACTIVGAEGVEMGTAFVATFECPVHENVKNAIVKAQDIDIIACGNCTGEPSWQINNLLAKRLIEIEDTNTKMAAAPLFMKASEGSLRVASMEGEVEESGAVLSGQVAGLIHSIRPVKELVVDFCQEWEACLKQTYTLM
jgi:enoyl-[acyl-carrier protein] reductase II